MVVSNKFYVGKGKLLALRGRKFREGSRFPAADLGLDERSFGSLIRDGSIVSGKERNAFVHPAPAPVRVAAPGAKVILPQQAPSPPFREKAEVAPAPADGLDEMKKDDLLDMAEDLGIPVKSRDSKEEIIKALRGATK